MSLALGQTPAYTARRRIHGYGASAPVYAAAFIRTQCAYPQGDGQAELTWVAGYTLR